ncbi:MAG: HK97 family phage prohead protease [Oxalicibacterium faecigallinarum]|uniref:HK97 family phage prohead protease n=1 Tax=Oxalicibacterium faecigallinarum TaxID=573741 RepID=UPI0028074C70|nr:HK97 family phage prohead protease [Oxalicibacterium faecigallinarum]MDQ7970747.1 HK97 family phage prohead protease [Oxalicibacterium faecigallinarum]
MKRKDAQLKYKQVGFKADAVNDDGTFTGYGSVFGNVDSYREIVAPGAFAESLQLIKQSGDPLPALWQHNSGEPIGGYDILEEDSKGLKVSGFLLKDEVKRAAEAFALMKRRIIKGLSIGYYVLEDSWNEKDRILTLTKLELREISIVTFPANELAQIDSVKSMLAAGRLPTLPEFEDFLREAGFSNTYSKAIAGHGLRKLLDQREADGKSSDVLKQLESFSLSL